MAWPDIFKALPGALGGLLTQDAYEQLGKIGERAYAGAQDIAQQGLQMSQFRPYTVTSATGGQFAAGPEGQYQLTMSPQEQALQQQLFGGAGQFYGQAQAPIAQTEQDVFNRLVDIASPERQRQQLALEERLAAQGRLGTSSAAFGGATPEQLALATAQQEQLNNLALQARQQALAEQQQAAQLGQGMLAASYVPQAQLLNAIQPGMTAAEAARQSQLYGTGQFTEGQMSGLQALLSSGLGQADLYGRLGTGLLSGFFAPAAGGGGSSFEDFLGIFGI